jgi:hypothetical protein
MRRTAKHGVRSPNAACTKKHSENEIWCIEPEAAVPNDKHRSPNPKTVRPKMKTNPDHEERGLAHRLRCCCACTEKEPSKTRAKEQTRREEQGEETTTNFAGVLEAERLLELATSSSRARPEQGRARERAGQRHVDAREKVESGRDLVCVAVRCTGGEHIVMRAVSRVRYRRAVASDRKKAERKGPSQYLYWICCNFVLENFPQNTELFGSFFPKYGAFFHIHSTSEA